MHQAVELILARMKSNPEDFNHEPYEQQTKWESIINHYSQYFTKEETDAVNKGYEDLREYNRVKKLDNCMEAIYQAMAGEGEEVIPTDDLVSRAIRRNQNRHALHNISPQTMARIEPPAHQILEDGLKNIFKEEYK